MRTSALFGAKNFGFVEIYSVSVRTRVGGGQFFVILYRDFMDGPLQKPL